MKQRLITTIFTLLCLTVFSTASYAWRTDWKAKADQMIVVSPEVKAEIAKSPDKAKLNKVVKVGQAFMKEELNGSAGAYEEGPKQDAYWKNVLSPLITMTEEEVFQPGRSFTAFEYDLNEGYLVCNQFSLDAIEPTDKGYVLTYHSIIATKINRKRYTLGEFTETEMQSPPDSGNTYWYRLHINHGNKVYNASFLNSMGSGWIGYVLETAKLYLDMAYKTKPGIITIAGEDSRESQTILYSKQLNFLTQANKACPKY